MVIAICTFHPVHQKSILCLQLSNADAVTFLGDFGNQKEMFAVKGTVKSVIQSVIFPKLEEVGRTTTKPNNNH